MPSVKQLEAGSPRGRGSVGRLATQRLTPPCFEVRSRPPNLNASQAGGSSHCTESTPGLSCTLPSALPVRPAVSAQCQRQWPARPRLQPPGHRDHDTVTVR